MQFELRKARKKYLQAANIKLAYANEEKMKVLFIHRRIILGTVLNLLADFAANLVCKAWSRTGTVDYVYEDQRSWDGGIHKRCC